MEKYILKSALVAEIERKMNLCKKILLRSRTQQDKEYHQGNIEAYEVVTSLLDTLEVKEVGVDLGDPRGDIEVKWVQEEPVSNDLEAEFVLYLKHKFNIPQEGNTLKTDGWKPSPYDILDIAKHFAQWQKEQMMKDAVEAVIHPYDGEIWVNKDLLSIYDDCQRVKVIIIKDE